MYLAVDIGGTKTLFAVFSPEGALLTKHKIPTAKSYEAFVKAVKKALLSDLQEYKISHACCAVPGRVNRKLGIALNLGNLNWHNMPIARDFRDILEGAPVLIENDANLAGLSEAILVRKKYKKVLYLTISTGIGDGVIIDGKIDPDLADGEVGHMVLEHDGKLVKWEDIASGRALKQQYGKLAKDITDPKIWAQFAENLALGLDALFAILQPEVLIIGGGVGAHLDKFNDKLDIALKKLGSEMVPIPPILQAKRAEEAVVYGCYEYIKQNQN